MKKLVVMLFTLILIGLILYFGEIITTHTRCFFEYSGGCLRLAMLREEEGKIEEAKKHFKSVCDKGYFGIGCWGLGRLEE